MARRKKSTNKGCLWGLLMLFIWPFYLIYLLIKALVKAAAPDPTAATPSGPRDKQKTNTDALTRGLAAAPAAAVKKMGVYPEKVDGHPRRYFYVLPFSAVDGVDVEKDILAGAEKIVEVEAEGDEIQLIHSGEIFGTIQDSDKARMVQDYKKRGNPVHAILLADGERVNLRFYRNLAAEAQNREQTVVTLTSYRGKAKQEVLSCLEQGDELELEDAENGVEVYRKGELIGKLPGKEAKRHLDGGAYLVTVEEVAEEMNDNGDYVYIPTVRIFW